MLIQQELQKSESIWFKIIRLLRWDKPAGRLILVIPTLWSMFLAARGTPPASLVSTVILLALASSAAGCAINDLWDRNIDSQVARTQNRPLASRALSIKIAVIVTSIALSCTVALASYLKPLSFWLLIAALPIILLYPLAKRVFPVPQLVLAIAWGFGVLISWSAISEHLEFSTWLLWGATVLWTLGFDTVYAMSDRENDLQIGINSSAIYFGRHAPTAVSIFFASTAFFFGLLGIDMQLGVSYWISFFLALLGWTRQCFQLYDPQLPNHAYNQIFGQNVWIGFLLLAGIIFGFFKL